MSNRDLVRVPFRGEQLEVVREGAQLWVSIRLICEVLGLHIVRQVRKLQSKLWAVTALKAVTAADGKKYRTVCIDLDRLPMWLATIDAGRVAPAVRGKLLAYQREAAQVLRNHFFGAKPTTAPGLTADEVRALVREELAKAGDDFELQHGSRAALPGRRPPPPAPQGMLPNPLEPVISRFLDGHSTDQPFTVGTILESILGRRPDRTEVNRAAHVIGPVLRKMGYHNPRVMFGEPLEKRRIRTWQPIIIARGVQ